MSEKDCNTKLLDLSNVLVYEVRETDDLIEIFSGTDKAEQVCPCCGRKTSKVHDYRIQKLIDVPIRKKKTLVYLRKRRYVCPHCGKRFSEYYDFLPRYQHITSRLNDSIIDSISKRNNYKQTAAEHFVSSSTVIKVLGMVNIEGHPPLPEVLGIDEYKGNSGGEKYQVHLTDIQNKKTLDILPTRKKQFLIGYFEEYSLEEREKVKYLVADMWKDYRSLKRLFPNAKVVVDRFHYVRQVHGAMDRKRKKVQKGLEKGQRIYFKRSRYLLHKKYEDLKTDEQLQLQNMLSKNQDLYDAWYLKELFNSMKTIEDFEQHKAAFRDWIETAKSYHLEEFNDCIKSFENWFDDIAESFRVPYSNGYTEGKNNLIKAIKRNGFGYRNFENFRRIILLCA